MKDIGGYIAKIKLEGCEIWDKSFYGQTIFSQIKDIINIHLFMIMLRNIGFRIFDKPILR